MSQLFEYLLEVKHGRFRIGFCDLPSWILVYQPHIVVAEPPAPYVDRTAEAEYYLAALVSLQVAYPDAFTPEIRAQLLKLANEIEQQLPPLYWTFLRLLFLFFLEHIEMKSREPSVCVNKCYPCLDCPIDHSPSSLDVDLYLICWPVPLRFSCLLSRI